MTVKRLFAALAAVVLAGGIASADPARAMSDRGDGIHVESWFVNGDTFYELPDELAAATRAGKGFMMIWEQQGCGSCRKLHEVNFQDPKLRSYMRDNFVVMSNNIFGEIPVVDFDGESRPEKDMAARIAVHRSPTTVFYKPDGSVAFTMPGYLDPLRYMAALVFVREKGYDDPAVQGNFLRWMQANMGRGAADVRRSGRLTAFLATQANAPAGASGRGRFDGRSGECVSGRTTAPGRSGRWRPWPVRG